jgi:hypothetical protein
MPFEELQKLFHSRMKRGLPISELPDSKRMDIGMDYATTASNAYPNPYQPSNHTSQTSTLSSQELLVSTFPLHGQINKIITASTQPPMMPTHINIPTTTPSSQQIIYPLAARVIPNIEVSNHISNPRFLKLKAELLCIYFAIPERLFKWPDDDEDSPSGQQKFDFNEEVATNDHTDLKPTDTSEALDLDDEAKKKSERKMKRRLRRKKALDKLIRQVQDAQTPEELLTVIQAQDQLIPFGLLLGYNLSTLPYSASTIADVAIRVYALDRALRYEEMKGMDACLIGAERTIRPRIHFCPRCALHPNCVRFFHHDGSCLYLENVDERRGTRIPEINDDVALIPPVQFANMQQHVQNMQQQQAQLAMKPNQLPTMPSYGNKPDQTSANVAAIAAMRAKQNITSAPSTSASESIAYQYAAANQRKLLGQEKDIESVHPYFPTATEISSTHWV